MFSFLIDSFVRIIEAGGYAGIAFLMTLESMIAPVPSEAVMPFAGFLWFEGKMTFIGIIFFSTLGSFVGSVLSYYIGLWGGRPLLEKYGKYLLLDHHHLEMTERFFARFGEKAIFISRFIPIIRHLISIPAGMGKMNLVKFISYTVIGAGLWNAFLAFAGYYLGEKWEEIRKYSEVLDIIVLVALVGLAIYFFRKQYLKHRQGVINRIKRFFRK